MNKNNGHNSRDRGGRWTPGTSGNPAGRPRGKGLTESLRQLAGEPADGDDMSRAERLAVKLWALALEGDRFAVGLIFDRIEGKAPAADDLLPSAGDREPIEIVIDDCGQYDG